MKRKRYQKTFKHVATFYTYWAIGFHLLYIFDLAPNTFIIALIVFVVSQILWRIYPAYVLQHWRQPMWRVNEFIFHWFPFLGFILRDRQEWGGGSGRLFTLLTIMLYILVHGHYSVYRYYVFMSDTVSDIRKI